MASGVKSWSTTDATNSAADSTIGWAEGQAPSTVNDSARAMMGRIADWYLLIDGGTNSGGTVGGTADAITLVHSPVIDALAHGQRYLFRAGSANTGAVTLTVDSTSATALRYRDTALVANDIAAGDIVLCMYDSNTGRFQMLNPPRLGAVTAAATQAQMEAASATNVAAVPGRVQYHPGVAKAWVVFQTRGTNGACTVDASHNVDGVARSASGTYVVTFTTDFSSTAYCALAITETSIGTNALNTVGTKAAGTCEILQQSASAGSALNSGTIHASFFGDQA